MKAFITKDTPVTDEVLNTIAHLPTKSLSKIVEDDFFKKLTDRDFMRIGVLLAKKGIRRRRLPDWRRNRQQRNAADRRQRAQHAGPGKPSLQSRRDVGRARCRPRRFQPDDNFLDAQPLRHLRGADLPAPISAAGRRRRHKFLGHGRPDSPKKGVQVDILEDPDGIALFAKYLKEKPDQHLEDAYGLAGGAQGCCVQDLKPRRLERPFTSRLLGSNLT